MTKLFLFVTFSIGILILNCEKPTEQNSSNIYRCSIGRISLSKTVLTDSSIISEESNIDTIPCKIEDISFQFNDSLWKIDSSKIFINQYIQSKLPSRANRDICNIEVSDSSIILSGLIFRYNYTFEDSVRLFWENYSDLNKIDIDGQIQFDSLHIPIFIEMSTDTLFSFISGISIDQLILKRKSVISRNPCCSNCDTLCIPTIKPLPSGYTNEVTYYIGEMVLSLH